MSVEILDHDLQSMYDTALEVAQKAGQMIKDAFSKEKDVEVKESFADFVTETDKAVEKEVNDIIVARFPSHKFIGEETIAETGAKCNLTDAPTWIIDPVDGTCNFVNKVHEVGFSLGVTVNKKVVIGVVYLPIKDEMFTARLGQGTFLNGKQIYANKTKDLKSALIITEAGNSRDPVFVNGVAQNMHKVYAASSGIRCYGSAAHDMCMVAAGRGDAYFEYGIHVWDICGGALIAQEAGAIVTDTSGGELNLLSRRVLVTCTPELTKPISSLLTPIDLESD